MKKLKLKNFEFSQNWLLFWDKLEKANYFLEAMIETADRDIDDRTVATILDNCVNDGGQWNMFVNIALKYGLVPKAAMPETLSSSATGSMNHALVGRLRVGAKLLRDMSTVIAPGRRHPKDKGKDPGRRVRDPSRAPGQSPGSFRLAVDRRQEEVPPPKRHDAEILL